MAKTKVVWLAAQAGALILATAALAQERVSDAGACGLCSYLGVPPIYTYCVNGVDIGYAYCANREVNGVTVCIFGGPICQSA